MKSEAGAVFASRCFCEDAFEYWTVKAVFKDKSSEVLDRGGPLGRLLAQLQPYLKADVDWSLVRRLVLRPSSSPRTRAVVRVADGVYSRDGRLLWEGPYFVLTRAEGFSLDVLLNVFGCAGVAADVASKIEDEAVLNIKVNDIAYAVEYKDGKAVAFQIPEGIYEIKAKDIFLAYIISRFVYNHRVLLVDRKILKRAAKPVKSPTAPVLELKKDLRWVRKTSSLFYTPDLGSALDEGSWPPLDFERGAWPQLYARLARGLRRGGILITAMDGAPPRFLGPTVGLLLKEGYLKENSDLLASLLGMWITMLWYSEHQLSRCNALHSARTCDAVGWLFMYCWSIDGCGI